MSKPFEFKKFKVAHDRCAMKVGTDAVLLGAWTTTGGRTMLDIGTGSGLIALMLAQRNTSALVHGVEVDEQSADQALSNFKNSPWPDRLESFHCDIKTFEPGIQYDLIVSNPPYFTNSTPAANKRRHNVRHNKQLTLSELLNEVNRLLADDGKFSVILPVVEGELLKREAATFDLFAERNAKFISRMGKSPERLLITFSRTACEVKEEEILHYDDDKWSEHYINLTKNFYTIL